MAIHHFTAAARAVYADFFFTGVSGSGSGQHGFGHFGCFVRIVLRRDVQKEIVLGTVQGNLHKFGAGDGGLFVRIERISV